MPQDNPLESRFGFYIDPRGALRILNNDNGLKINLYIGNTQSGDEYVTGEMDPSGKSVPPGPYSTAEWNQGNI